MKITLSKTGLLPNKLHDELLGVITEPFSLTHNDENIFLNFKEINKIVDEEEVSTYTKNIYTPTIIDEVEVIVKSTIDYTTEFEAVISTCNTCVSVHDNTPLPVPKTAIEVAKSDVAILYKWQLKMDGVI